jgi:hypothetical protein
MTTTDGRRASATAGARRGLLLLLLIPYIGTLWVASYASVTPELWGIPFFYWYQFLWIGIGAAITIFVYLLDAPGAGTSGDAPR